MHKKGNGVIERKAMVFNIQKYNMYDGPGVRTIIFFQGCPLRCKWCANPEGLMKKYRVMYKANMCTNCGECANICPVGIHKMDGTNTHSIDRNIDCIGCKRCETNCCNNALKIVGESKSISELLEVIEEDRAFYDVSGGGVTLGGGEVLMQADAATSLLMACKEVGINTAIETCGYATHEAIMKVAEFTDLFLFDIKQIDSEKHFYWTGVRNEQILENVQWLLKEKYNVQIRMPLLKGVNSTKEDIEGVIKFLLPYKDYKNFKGVDLLPYHKMGVNKYDQLGMEYLIKEEVALSNEELDKIESWIKEYDLFVKVIRH